AMDVKSETVYNNIPVANVPMQRNYRTNIVGNLLTSGAVFNVVINPIYNEPDNIIVMNEVNSDEGLEAALRQNEEHIVVNLGVKGGSASEKSEYTVNIGAWQPQYYFGGEKTKTITINGNGHKINFKQNNSDWDYIRCVNEDAKWFLNDVELTNSGYNSSYWGRMGIAFYNEVEMNGVTSERGIIVQNKAVLNNVKVNEGREAYSLWITAEGQTVTVKNSEFTATNSGRGIKIGDENVKETLAKVVLNVENTKFTTAKKAAILVSSAAGADIALTNVDIAGVAADGFNAVWVDSDWSQYADLVTVTGGFKKVEGSSASLTATENATIEIPAGTYKMPTDIADGVSIIGGEGVVFMVAGNSITSDNVTIKDIAIVNDKKSKTALSVSGKNPTIEGCVFSGAAGNGNGLVVKGEGADNVITVKNCDFSQDDFFKPIFDGWSGLGGGTLLIDGCTIANGLYVMHIDAAGESGKIVVKNSKLSGFITNGASLDSVSFENCVFGEANGYACANLYTSHSFVDCTFPTKADANNVNNYGLYVSSSAKGDAMVMNNCKMSDGTMLDKTNMAVTNGGFLHWDAEAEACVWTVNGVAISQE
ncbi:MAG: hypothetical protein IJ328_03860, partial [Muribaculaceae bacterium]|nr:hypothetical protein [Muribaculaceae bacterium]